MYNVIYNLNNALYLKPHCPDTVEMMHSMHILGRATTRRDTFLLTHCVCMTILVVLGGYQWVTRGCRIILIINKKSYLGSRCWLDFPNISIQIVLITGM